MNFVWKFSTEPILLVPPPWPRWALLPVILIWIVIAVVACICRGDEDETRAFRDPIDEAQPPKED
jgi:hypothetical protein